MYYTYLSKIARAKGQGPRPKAKGPRPRVKNPRPKLPLTYYPRYMQPAKKGLRRDQRPKRKKPLFPTVYPPVQPLDDRTKKYIRATIFRYSQLVLFHPWLFKMGTYLYPELTRGEQVPKTTSDWWNLDTIIQARKYLPPIYKLRLAFMKLLHHWRFKHLKIANTDDIVTMDPPKKPVYIVNWKSRTAHVFEASTLMRDITERLLHHDGVFEESAEPRNPFTNSPLTQAQMISLWNQISLYGIHTSTAFSAFRQARWNMQTFQTEYTAMLKLNALRKTMKNPDEYDYMDRMMDFIQYVYEAKSELCDVTLYKNAIRYKNGNSIVQGWQRLCTLYYESLILYTNNAERFKEINDRIFDRATVFMGRENELKFPVK